MDIKFVKISETPNTKYIKEAIIQDSSGENYIKFVEILLPANNITDVEII